MMRSSMLLSNLHKPGECHIVSAKRALRYLNWTNGWWPVMNPDGDYHLTAVIDASFVSTFDEGRKSRSWLLVEYGNAAVAVNTNLQKGVSLGSTEADYTVLSKAVQAAVWLRNAHTELVVRQISLRNFGVDAVCPEWTSGKVSQQAPAQWHQT